MLKISIIGLGYVGLPLTLMLSKSYQIVGYDINLTRISELNEFYDSNQQHSKKELKKSKNVIFSADHSDLKNSDIFIVTVPTPVINLKPDLRILKKASILVANYLQKNGIVVFESTVYPGITENFCGKIISQKSGLTYKKDFHLAYSPERVNPGDTKRTIDKIYKVLGASNTKTLNKVKKIYKSFLGNKVFTVSDIKTAEASKVIENAQRDINIAFMNELNEIFYNAGININNVLKAASTKWNFLNFEPGLVGGHCIGVDPYYLAEFAKRSGVIPKVILAGRNTNENATKFVFDICISMIKNIKKPKILMLGITFKENCPDIRNSKLIELYNKFKINNIIVDAYDPWVQNNVIKNLDLNLLNTIPNKESYNLIFIGVKHSIFKKMGMKKIKKMSTLKSVKIFDYKGIFK